MHKRRIISLAMPLFALLVSAPHALAQRVEWDSVYFYRNLFFRGIDCADRANCGAVGTDGSRATILFVTTDGGATWHPKIIEDYATTRYLPAEPYDVANPSPATFVVAADSGIIWTTTDGGASFRKIRLPINGVVGDIEMWDTLRGVAARNTNELYVTLDGWQTWRHVPVADSIARLLKVELHAFGVDTLLFVAFNSTTRKTHTLLTSDYGASWTKRPAMPDPLTISSADHRLIVAAGSRFVDTPKTVASRTVAWISTDFGITWQPTLDTVHRSGHGTAGISMADSRFGITYGPFGQVWATSDGGRSWAADTLPPLLGFGTSFRDVFAFSDGSALAVMGAEYITARRPLRSNVDDADPEMANDHVMIRFDQSSGLVALSVVERANERIDPMLYNAIGQQVDVEIRRSPACRDNALCWTIDVAGLSRGLYIVGLRGSSRSIPLIVSGQ